MAQPDESFYDDPSSHMQLSHSATKAEETETCESCGTRYLTTDKAGHICGPVFNSQVNPTLRDERWNEHNNRKLEAEAKAAGETLPEKDVETGEHTNAGAYSTIEERIGELMQHGDLSLAEATRIARQERTIVVEQERVKHGDDCGMDCPVCNNVTDDTLKRAGLKVKGGSKNSGKFRRDKRVKKSGTIGVQIEDEPRTNFVGARVTESTQYALDDIKAKTGVNVAALLAAIGVLRDRGDIVAQRTIREILAAAPGNESEEVA